MNNLGGISLAKKKLIYFLLIIGVILAIIGLIFNPSFVAKHLSHDGVLEKSTISDIYKLESFAITLGFIICLYSLNKFTKSTFGKFNEAVFIHKIVLFGLIITLLLLILPFLLYEVTRISYVNPIDYSEGWNTIHTTRLLHGKPLYVPLITGFPLTPVNYPPLGFIIIGALSYFIGLSVLQTGRIVSLISLLFVGYLIYGIITNFTSKKWGALLGALMWVALIARLAKDYVSMYNPQMLGHVFSLGALYFYSSRVNELTVRRACVLALLCCFALFIKFLLIAVPITLAISIFFNSRRYFGVFALAGIIISSLMIFGSWLYGREYFFSNIIGFESARLAWNMKMIINIRDLFATHFAYVFFFPFIALLFNCQRKWMSVPVYFSISFLLGSYFIRAHGVTVNAWFDFFISVAIVLGLLAAELIKPEIFWKRILVCGVLASCLLPFFINLRGDLNEVLNYNRLKQQEKDYRTSVELLRSIDGAALFEEPLLGFDAGKEFLFDPFIGTDLIWSRRIPERVLTDAIREQKFGAIVFEVSLDKEELWTHNIIKAIKDNYELLNLRYHSPYFFYTPRKKTHISW